MSVVNKIRCKNVIYEIEDEDAQNDIANIYTKEEVDNLISALTKLDLKVVEELPTESISTSTIYLIAIDPADTSKGYNEYVYSNDTWVLIGKTTTEVTNYYTKDQVDNLLDEKQDVLTIDSELSTDSTNPVENKVITLTLNSKVDTTTFLEQLALKADKSEIPSKVSDLENDSNFITDDNYVHTDNNFTDELKNKVDGIEAGANANVQSDWNEDDDTKDDYIKNKPELAAVATSGDYKDLYNAPISLSSFKNDTNFVTNTVNNLENYYLKTESYSKTEIDKLISDKAGIGITIVETLPTEGKANIIYLVPSTKTSESDIYDEYLYISSKWERIGSSKIDLSDYYTKTEIDTKLSGKADSFSTLEISKGGTGGTTANEATFNLFNGMNSAITDITDNDEIITPIPSANTTTGSFFKRSVSYLWNWIKSKISSDLGLTKDSYGGSVASADSATKASQDASGKDIEDTYATKSEIPTSLPASDVYEWAKAETKPTYNASEVGAAATSHTHIASDINAMTGYTKPEATSSIAATDSLNQAIGKLEKAIDGKSSGTVTSVQVQATSPVVSSVNTAQTSSLDTTISLADSYGDTKNPYAAKTANYVLAAPNGSNGVPTFRALVASDIPSLSYLPSTGGTLTGNLTVSTSGASNINAYSSSTTGGPRVIASTDNVSVGLHVGTGGTNRGLYDFTSDKWLVYNNGTTVTLNGDCTGSSSTSGYATSAGSSTVLSPSHTAKALTTVSATRIVYVKIATEAWSANSCLHILVSGNSLKDEVYLMINAGNSTAITLCGWAGTNSSNTMSAIVVRGSAWNSDYAIWLKIRQATTATVSVAKMWGTCTINSADKFNETTTSPGGTEYTITRGFFGGGNVASSDYATNLGTSSGYYNYAKLNNLLTGSATPTEYANKTAYAVGAYVWYSNNLYKCTTAVAATNTSWPSTSFTQVVPLPVSVTSATKATQDGSGNTITSTYLKLSGGDMSGHIKLNSTSSAAVSIQDASGNSILFVNNGTDASGPGTTSATCVGDVSLPQYLRSSGNNLYHFRSDKSASYLLLDASNYTDYVPTKTGTGASGSWEISITGSAASVTNGVYTNTAQTITGQKTFTSEILAYSASVNSNNSGSSGGLALYSTNPESYGIIMRRTADNQGVTDASTKANYTTLGTHGYVTSDWGVYFCMGANASTKMNRGWIFRRSDQTATNVASIDLYGNACFNGKVKTTDSVIVSNCTMKYNSSTLSLDFTFS